MARKARTDALDALHHIIVRGIERSKIFKDESDCENFVERFGLIVSATGAKCFAWALIPNHVHLLLRTGAAPIATVMRRPNRELGMATVDISKRLKICQSAVSRASLRGEKIEKSKNW